MLPADGTRKTWLVPIAIGLSCLMCASAASALDPDRSLAQIHHTTWTIEDGAPTQVTALAQTTDGYLWIGSSLGLFRFDGIAFEEYAPPPGKTLPSHNIYALVATDEGLWVSFRPFGLALIRNDQFIVQKGPWDDPPAEIFALEGDHDGRVWAGTSKGLVFRDGTGWHDVGPEWSFTKERIWSLFADREGMLWVATATTLYSLPRGKRSFERVQGDLRNVYSSHLAQSRDGRIWLIDDNDPDFLRVVGMKPGRRPHVPLNAHAYELFIDRDDCMWLGGDADGALFRVRSHDTIGNASSQASAVRIERFTQRDGLSGRTSALFEDREGSIWVGTTGGLDRFRHNRLVTVVLPYRQPSMTLLPADSGVVWVGNANELPMVRIQGDTVKAVDKLKGVASVYRDPQGVAWWGGVSAIGRQDAKGAAFTIFDPEQTRWIWEVFPGDEPGLLWLSFDEIGLVAFENGRLSQRAPPAGLPVGRGPSASFPTPDGRVWLGYINGVFVIENGRVTAYSQEDGIDIGRVRVIRGRDSQVWVGGEVGLALFHAGRFWPVVGEDGESFGTVSGMIASRGGELWLNELKGIVRIPRREVAKLLVDPQHRIRYRRYDHLDGMSGRGQMNWTCATAAEGSDGLLWFATDNGLVRVDPTQVTIDATPPPLAIRSISTTTKSYLPSPGLRLPKKTSTLTIQYAVTSLAEPERVRFRYRLEGVDREWRVAGSARAATYTRLRPGQYRFEVIGANADGVWATTGASLVFSILPEFYQTGWFMVLMALMALAIIWALYRVRVRQVTSRLQRLHEERLDERLRISHELHDTLLQGFLSASMQLHVEANTAPPGSPTRSGLERILALMRTVTDDARNTLRGLRSYREKATDLEAAFSITAQEFAAASTARFRLAVHGRSRVLQPMVRDEVYRVGREALSNAFQHAHASVIEMEVGYLPSELGVCVRDDGRGVEPEVLRDGREGHWGLAGMRERAARVGARLSIRPSGQGGIEVMLRVPGQIAYAHPESGNWLTRFADWIRARTRPRRPLDGEK
jgi:signal transduction histidine kinase/ligand-binding sensor domain-containing protein